jgi:amidophosphoribosyltransferase
LTAEIEAEMAKQLRADSLRYLPVESVARAICLDADQLCRACITGQYPTPCGRELAKKAMDNFKNGVTGRTYEVRDQGLGVRG